MADFTPGPWEWWTSNSWHRLKHDDRGKTANVLEPYVCPDGHPDCVVNNAGMALIAAAPDLYAALERITSVVDAAGAHNLSNGVQLGQTSWYIKMTDALRESKDALAKAEGKSPLPVVGGE